MWIGRRSVRVQLTLIYKGQVAKDKPFWEKPNPKKKAKSLQQQKLRQKLELRNQDIRGYLVDSAAVAGQGNSFGLERAPTTRFLVRSKSS